MSSIFLVSGSASTPAGLTLQADGQAVTMPGIALLGSGVSGGSATFWRISSYLQASTTYVLSNTTGGATSELTRFTTTPSYDKNPGQAPVLDNLRLWRVRYPVSQIAAGGCVFAEYEGYIDLNYQDGSLPGTPAEEVITVLTLAPKTGGDSQTFVFAGLSHFEGAPLYDSATGAVVDVPDGGVPSPVYALWKPALEPDREYCATLTLYGRNDQAMGNVVSNSVCAAVMNVSAGPDTGGNGSTSSGCTLGGRNSSGSWAFALAALAIVVGVRRRRARRCHSSSK
jgi:MYXO-CTERM domain-containing protein